jgi:hypothetical protein
MHGAIPQQFLLHAPEDCFRHVPADVKRSRFAQLVSGSEAPDGIRAYLARACSPASG